MISIGIVSECGCEYYAELHEGWSFADCSLFTLTQVLPYLAESHMTKTLRDVLGEKFEILRCHTNEPPDWHVLSSPGGMFTPELWSWIGKLESKAPLLDHYGKIGEVDLGSLLVKDDPYLLESLAEINIEDVMAGSGSLALEQAALSLSRWVGSFQGGARVFWDYQKDRDLAESLLKLNRTFSTDLNFFPVRWEYISSPEIRREIKDAGQRQCSFAGRRHHALEDARVFRAMWQKGRELEVW